MRLRRRRRYGCSTVYWLLRSSEMDKVVLALFLCFMITCPAITVATVIKGS